MQNLNYLKRNATSKYNRFSVIKRAGLALLLLSTIITGCKKDSTPANGDRDYGYAKIVVKCEKKCNVSYVNPDNKNATFEVTANTAVYYPRYQRNYNLKITITPTERQNVELGVYSREEKQIFFNPSIREANVDWVTEVTIP
ncbi:MAG: hypothetical protein JKY70_20875 [Mucilaginibacter sp.]|nr:hypothetical protein [Mucilaginibacter sp.]